LLLSENAAASDGDLGVRFFVVTPGAEEAFMPKLVTASQQITDEVTSWPGVEAGPGPRGEFGFRVGGRELGHLHGDVAAHFSFPKSLGLRLRAEERVVDHPVFPGKPGFGARRIEDDADVRDVIEMMRLNYDRITARDRLPEGKMQSLD
jgi:Family of unknown function (DUF5519)